LRCEYGKYIADNFEELADSPFIASRAIQSASYDCGGSRFHIHFNGECRPDWDRIISDFRKFTEVQLKFWGAVPVKEYHFLIQVLNTKFYHGVEHQKSTVICLGPGHSLNNGKTYEDLLGVCSHELFHAWNIKYIRPVEMNPYNYTRENYARTGYVYEGFTTYYGDLMLRKSGVFTDEQYFETLEERLDKHFHNPGRFNLSVADSSWDTWLDGYVPGVPGRKTSIYDEGNLIAFLIDVLIRQHSQNAASLQDLCRKLCVDFAQKGKGYTEEDVIRIAESLGGVAVKSLFTDLVYGTHSYEPALLDCMAYLGLKIEIMPNAHLNERFLGFKCQEAGGISKITAIAPESPAWKAGLSLSDELLAVNDCILKNDLNNWLQYFKSQDLRFTINRMGRLKTVTLPPASDLDSFFEHRKIRHLDEKNPHPNFLSWIS
jgi:predicted metalloprotease with PDZ domain